MKFKSYVPTAVQKQIEVETLARCGKQSAYLDCLQRLAHDDRMRLVYERLLKNEITTDPEWRNFIRAACTARMDYVKCRERLEKAANLKEQIATKAEELAELIRQFEAKGIPGPVEFYSIRELLRQTDNAEHDIMWQYQRHLVLGNPPELRDDLHYAWGTAPSISTLLGTLADKARNFTPSASARIEAALNRKSDPKMEYLRAFDQQLANFHGFEPTLNFRKAMAIVANVAINLRDVDVSEKEVWGVVDKRLKKSGEK